MFLNILILLTVLALPVPSLAAQPSRDAEDPSRALTAAGFQLPAKPLTATDFTLPSLDGTDISLSSYRGKVVLLNFWATWCPPCRAEMPSMETLYRRLAPDGFEIVAVDLQEPEDVVRNYITDNGHTFPVLLDRNGSAGRTYAVRGIPTSYLIGRDGTVLAMTVGGRDWMAPSVLKAIESLLDDER